MDPKVRQAALLAALKTTRGTEASWTVPVRRRAVRSTLVLGLQGAFVGGAALASGCAMQHGVPPVIMGDAPTADAAVAPDVPADPDVPMLADAPTDCDSHLGSLAITTPDPEGWGAQFTSEAARNDATTAACCHQMELDVRAAHARGEPTGWPPSDLAFACCDVVVFVHHLEPSSELGCTPWGPPCPPSMPA